MAEVQHQTAGDMIRLRRQRLKHYLTRAEHLPAGLMASTGWMTYSYLVGFTVQGLYFVILARVLGPAHLGVFAGALALVDILAPFAGVGSGNVLVMRSARNSSEYSDALGTALIYLGVSAVLMLGACYTACRAADPALSGILLPLGLSELISLRLVDLAAQAYQAHDRIRGSAHINVGAAAVRLGGVGLFVVVSLAHRGSVLNWCWFYSASSATAALLSMGWTLSRFGGPRCSLASLRKTWRRGAFFALGTSSKTVYVDIDKFMLLQIGTATAAGIYTAAYRLVAMAFAPIQALVYASNTAMFREGARGARCSFRLVRRLSPLVVGCGATASILLIAGSPLVSVVLGRSYSTSDEALRWLAFMPTIQGLHYLLGDTLMGLDRQAIRSLLQCVTAGLNVGLNLFLIPAWSWRGAAVATYLGEGSLVLTSLLVFWVFVRRDRNGGDNEPTEVALKPGAELGP